MDTDDGTVYDDLGVTTVVNAAGTKTRVGGTLIREGAADAMREAAGSFARVSDLQARASELIADVTGAEAGYVASGAASALTLGAAACIAGDDPAAMARLPHTDGMPDEVVAPRTHRNGYDHAIRAAGARIVDVGTADATLGVAATDVEPWELRAAIGEGTVAVSYLVAAGSPPLEEVVEIAHDEGVPVLVDAAAELPPRRNLSAFVDAGADLVAFSGGKAVRGPQSTGFLAGRADLIRSVALQHLDTDAVASVWEPPDDLIDVGRLDGVPRHGIGRGMKVGTEELVGLIYALREYVEEDEDALLAGYRDRAGRIADGLSGSGTLAVALGDGDGPGAITRVRVRHDDGADAARDLVRALRREDPRVVVNAAGVDDGAFVVDPTCLSDSEAGYVVERILANLG